MSNFKLYRLDIFDFNLDNCLLFRKNFDSLSSAKRSLMYFVRSNDFFDSLHFWLTVFVLDSVTFEVIDFYGYSWTGFAREYKNKLEVKKYE